MKAFVVNEPNGALPRLERTSAGAPQASWGDICRLRKSDDSYVTFVASYDWVDVGLLETLEWVSGSFEFSYYGTYTPASPKPNEHWITPQGMVKKFSLGWEIV